MCSDFYQAHNAGACFYVEWITFFMEKGQCLLRRLPKSPAVMATLFRQLVWQSATWPPRRPLFQDSSHIALGPGHAGATDKGTRDDFLSNGLSIASLKACGT